MAESLAERLLSLRGTTLWSESPEWRRRRRIQLLVLAPFGGIAGGAYGLRATPTGAEAWPLVLLAVAGVLLFVWSQGILLPVVRRSLLGEEERGRALFDFVWEGGVGAVVVLGAIRLLDTPPVASAGLATAVGGFLAWGLAGLAGGRGIELGLSSIFGWGGSSTPRESDYSAVRARAVRGDVDGALVMLGAAVEADPRDPVPYRTAAAVLIESGRIEEAVRWLRRARREARLSDEEAVRVARRTAELILHRTEEPRRAAGELAWIVEHAADPVTRGWAVEELGRVKAGMGKN